MVLYYVIYPIPHLHIPRMSQTDRDLALNCFQVHIDTNVKEGSLPGGTKIGRGTEVHGLYGSLYVFPLETAQASRLACL